MLFSFPKKAWVDRTIPKSAIYSAGQVSSRVKELFVSQVDRIVLSYALQPQSINIPATADVAEIDIFRIDLRQEKLDLDVLKTIDAAMPRPAIFELRYDGKVQVVACYKRPNEADRSKWVRSEYYSTDWIGSDAERVPLPAALNLGSLYEYLLRGIIPIASNAREPIASLVSRMEKIRTKQREVDQVAGRLAKEKQFNRKVELNSNLRQLKQELETLRQAPGA
ncbi:DUF4391 domain-containing protein [Mariprofundus erugo]|uniref:DUF4391 domain-containing protein n=1 Tax=Mariprofundus erugo TaxID=2528639 RepID=UPI0010FF4AE7|nr:DUF4391 domain-containing protein [Mariprofundus erugo]TLS75309.1 DUF4391 domain-containing protein [Mariprofundus erugo]